MKNSKNKLRKRNFCSFLDSISGLQRDKFVILLYNGSMAKVEKQNTHLAIFKGKKIRKTIFQKEWWFSVVDVCGGLTDSPDVGAYWKN